MKTPPMDYGDNFPVTTGIWDPAVPWRFPHHTPVRLKAPSLLHQMLPWIMLCLGVALGILLMSWRFGVTNANAVVVAPEVKPAESAEQLLPQWEFTPRQPAGSAPKKHSPRRTRTGLA